MSEMVKPYESVAEIEEVVRRFEACSFAPGEFKHRQHLTVALLYLSNSNVPEAARRMRASLYKFLSHHGIDSQKYHETITLFWLKKLEALLSQKRKGASLVEATNEVLDTCSDAKLVFTYYSTELIATAAARAGWVEPDLQPLDF